MGEPWIVEMDTGGINWTPIAQCHSKAQAEKLATAPHVVNFGKARVRQRWHDIDGNAGMGRGKKTA